MTAAVVATVIAALSLPQAAVAAPGDDRVLIPAEKVSIQMFSLIPWTNSAGRPAVFERLGEIGFQNIEPFGSTFSGYTATDFKALMDSNGLKVPSSHYNVGEATFDTTLAFVDTIGQEYVGSGGFASPGIGTYANTLATAATMNRLGERSVAAGIGKFFGHNHAVEFTTMYEHEGVMMSAWEILVAETNPEWVTFQLDVGWATDAGVNAAEIITEYADRIDLLHIKDAVNLGGAGNPQFRNLGQGDVPLQDILAAAVAADINYYVMEYDQSPNGESFAAEGFEYLTGSFEETVSKGRISGQDRFDTSVKISQQSYPESAPVVYVADGMTYPDSLSAGPAAAFEGGPLLLVTPNSVPGGIVSEITRLNPERIVVVGGTSSVSETVYTQLSGLADEITRINGADRFETSRLVADYAFGDAGASMAYIAAGATFADALAAGGAAGAKDAPVILVNGVQFDLDSATATLLGDLGVTDSRVLGGLNSVSEGIFEDVDGITTAVRLAGDSRYETARVINSDAFESAERAFLATGLNFPDALAGSAWAGAAGAPLYTVLTNCVPQGVLDDLEALGVTEVILLGGTPTLTAEVFALTPCA